MDRTELAKLGDSVTPLEAVRFIVRTADKRPWVINLSMGAAAKSMMVLPLSSRGLMRRCGSLPAA